jgi:uncharacterized protein (TIGR02466 family)
MIYPLFPVPVYVDTNENLVKDALNIFSFWEKQERKLNVNGFLTTLKDYNGFSAESTHDILNLPETKILIEYIKQSVYNMHKEVSLSTNYDVVVSNLWLNEMTSNTESYKHNHYGYSYSGCFYVSCPNDSGKITFHSLNHEIGNQKSYHATEYNVFNSNSWWIPVEAGIIAIWPSYLKHSVPAQSFEGVRRSIAFDITLHANIVCYGFTNSI